MIRAIACALIVLYILIPAQASAYEKQPHDLITSGVHLAYIQEDVPRSMWDKLDYIWHHESLNNTAHSNRYRGIWQLDKSMCRVIEWWNPHTLTHRALRYMRGHRYAGYGRGYMAAYKHKKRYGWY